MVCVGMTWCVWACVCIQGGGDKKSRLGAFMDAIERVTGFDLDGDGTVAGDILSEVPIHTHTMHTHACWRVCQESQYAHMRSG